MPLDIPLYWHKHCSQIPFTSFRAMQKIYPTTSEDTPDGRTCLYNVEFIPQTPDKEPDYWNQPDL